MCLVSLSTLGTEEVNLNLEDNKSKDHIALYP